MKDIAKTIQSQYANSTNIIRLIEELNTIIDFEQDENLFYTNLYNIYTANGKGLDILGSIVGIDRAIQLQATSFFGFNGQGSEGFNANSFYKKSLTDTYLFTDDAYRKLILIKCAINVSSADASTINSILKTLFEQGQAYVLEVKNMHIRYVFEFELQAFEKALLSMGFINKPAGVSYEYIDVDIANTFGFLGSDFSNFNNSSFSLAPAFMGY